MPEITITALGAASEIAGYGGVYAKSETTQHPSASVIKLVTALVARDWVSDAELPDTVTVETGDTHGPTTAQLQVGDVITWGDLLYGMLVPSGNDAAKTIGREIGEKIVADEGSSDSPRDRFVVAMNAKLSELGLVDAFAYTAYGAEESSTVSAKDAIVLMRTAAADSFLRTVMGTMVHDITITGVNARTYSVTHTIAPTVGDFPEFIAAKTGTVYSGANVVMLWGAPDGGEVISSVNAASGNRYDDLREVVGYTIMQSAVINSPVKRRGQLLPGVLAHVEAYVPTPTDGPPPVIVVSHVGAVSAPVASVAAPISSSAQVGDLLVVEVLFRGSSLAIPSGFTLYDSLQNSSADFNQGIAILTKVIDSSDIGSTYTVAYSSGTNRLQVAHLITRKGLGLTPQIENLTLTHHKDGSAPSAPITPGLDGVTRSSVNWVYNGTGGSLTEVFLDGESYSRRANGTDGSRIAAFTTASQVGTPFAPEWEVEAGFSSGGQSYKIVNYNVV